MLHHLCVVGASSVGSNGISMSSLYGQKSTTVFFSTCLLHEALFERKAYISLIFLLYKPQRILTNLDVIICTQRQGYIFVNPMKRIKLRREEE